MREFIMERTSISVTMACNLKCALCSNYMPYYKAPKTFSVSRIKDMLEHYFNIVTYVKKFTISGGEPFFHPDLPKIIGVFNDYHDNIGVLEILTNGTLPVKEELLDAILKYEGKISVLIDNYGENLSVNAGSVRETLDKNGVNYVFRNNHAQEAHIGGWVDFGDLMTKKRATKEETESIYLKCAQPQKFKFCFNMVDGVMHPCIPSRRCKELGMIPDNYDEYINVFDENLTVEEQRRKIEAIQNGTSLAACAFCDGLCEDSERFTPAVQLTEEERACIRDGAQIYADVCRMMQERR